MYRVWENEEMQRTKTITIPPIPQKTQEVSIYGCDVCGHESKQATSFKKCYLCGRLVCNTYNDKCGGFDPRESGDYPDFYCNICFELKFKKYAQEYEDIENDYSNKLELLEKKIREESLAH